MKIPHRFLIAVAAIGAVLVAQGCVSMEQTNAHNKLQYDLAKLVVESNDKREIERMKKQAEVAVEREKRLTAEAEARKIKYGALMTIATTADAGGKAAIGVSVARDNEVDALAGAAKAEPVIAASAPIQIPAIAPPRSASQEAREWVGLGLQALGIVKDGYVIAKQVSGQVAINGQNTAAATAQHGATMAAFTAQSGNQTALGVAAVNAAAQGQASTVQSIEQMIAELTKFPSIEAGNEATIAINGSTVNINKCPQGQQGSAGNGGPGGTGNTSGGTGGANNQTATVGCTAGK